MDPQTQIDRTKLTTEQVAMLDQWQFSHDQLEKLGEVAELLQKLTDSLEQGTEKGTEATSGVSGILAEIDTTLQAIRDKQDPEAPDNTPIVDAVNQLEKAFTQVMGGLNVTPTVNVPAPIVNVSPTKVDLTGIEKLFKSHIPGAFNDAIASIPAPIPDDDTPFLERLDQILVALGDIDKATRLKVQAPKSMIVTNPDGSNVGNDTANPVTARYDYASSPIYVGEAAVGTSDSSTGWTITKFDLSDSSDASGKISTNVSWVNRATGTYA